MKRFILLLVSVISFYSCSKENPNVIAPMEGSAPTVPTLTLPANNALNQTISPILNWNLSSGAESYVLQVSQNSSFSSFVFNQGSVAGTRIQLTGLNYDSEYYWRVSATNGYGTSSNSPVWSFKTVSSGGGSPCSGIPTVTYEGKTYNTIQIGSQCWLKENLDVGTMIDVSQSASNNGQIEKYCHGGNPANCITYGGLYQWNEAMAYSTIPGTKGICPNGFHIPTNSELETLSASINNNSNALKSIEQGTGEGAGTNTSGFSGLLAGFRNPSSEYHGLGTYTFFWSSTEYNLNSAQMASLNFYGSNVTFYYDSKELGFSVRCIKD